MFVCNRCLFSFPSRSFLIQARPKMFSTKFSQFSLKTSCFLRLFVATRKELVYNSKMRFRSNYLPHNFTVFHN